MHSKGGALAVWYPFSYINSTFWGEEGHGAGGPRLDPRLHLYLIWPTKICLKPKHITAVSTRLDLNVFSKRGTRLCLGLCLHSKHNFNSVENGLS